MHYKYGSSVTQKILNHRYLLYLPTCTSRIRSHRILSRWNELSPHEIDFNSIASFKSYLTSEQLLRHCKDSFYSASAWLVMQSAILARAILSVCPSVTLWYCVQTNEDTIVRFSASGRTIPLVSGEVKFIRIFEGDHPQPGR